MRRPAKNCGREPAMKEPPPYPDDDVALSVEQIAFLILPLWLRQVARRLDEEKVEADTDAIRDGADEILRLRLKYEPEWIGGEYD